MHHPGPVCAHEEQNHVYFSQTDGLADFSLWSISFNPCCSFSTEHLAKAIPSRAVAPSSFTDIHPERRQYFMFSRERSSNCCHLAPWCKKIRTYCLYTQMSSRYDLKWCQKANSEWRRIYRPQSKWVEWSHHFFTKWQDNQFSFKRKTITWPSPSTSQDMYHFMKRRSWEAESWEA